MATIDMRLGMTVLLLILWYAVYLLYPSHVHKKYDENKVKRKSENFRIYISCDVMFAKKISVRQIAHLDSIFFLLANEAPIWATHIHVYEKIAYTGVINEFDRWGGSHNPCFILCN